MHVMKQLFAGEQLKVACFTLSLLRVYHPISHSLSGCVFVIVERMHVEKKH